MKKTIRDHVFQVKRDPKIDEIPVFFLDGSCLVSRVDFFRLKVVFWWSFARLGRISVGFGTPKCQRDFPSFWSFRGLGAKGHPKSSQDLSKTTPRHHFDDFLIKFGHFWDQIRTIFRGISETNNVRGVFLCRVG